MREQAQKFLRDKCPADLVRGLLESDEPYSKTLWQQIIELGWSAATVPEAYGGLGMEHIELCVLAEELGRFLAPTPFASSVYLATEALLLFGSEDQKQRYLPRLAAGELIATYAATEVPGGCRPDNLASRVDDCVLYGTKTPVPDGDIADFAIILAADKQGTSFYLVDLSADDVRRTSIDTIDSSRSHATIEFNHAAVELLGTMGSGWEQQEQLFDRAAVLFAFEQIGGAQATLDMSRNYALERYAFGRPIASFQAIKHKLADMYVALSLARSNCYYGAWALSTDAPDLAIAAATARVSATQAYEFCAKENIQTHGGMGFTWEFDCHLYYRRSRLLAVNLGNLAFWKSRLIDQIEQENI